MAKITEKELMQDSDFKCARCQTDCTKINASEPELGYMSHASGHEGEFVGPLCSDCFNKIPVKDQLVKTIPETAFLVVVKSNGEGTFVTTADISMPYLREPTFNDIISACGTVSMDVHDAIVAQKLTNQIVRTLSVTQKQPKLLVPNIGR